MRPRRARIDTLVKYFRGGARAAAGIRVNAVAPGRDRHTDMSNLVKTDEGKSFVLGMQALKRIGQPDDVRLGCGRSSPRKTRVGSPATPSRVDGGFEALSLGR